MRLFDDNLIEMKKEGTVDLRTIFPVSYRRIIRRVFPWLVISLVLNGVFWYFARSLKEWGASETWLLPIQNISLFLIAVSFILCLGKFIYEHLYHSRYRYAIEAGHLVICKGLILKERGSFPLSRITEVYLDRTYLDLLFGLYIVHISTPTSHSGEFAHIVGLSQQNALELQETITDALDSPLDMEMAQVSIEKNKKKK